MFESTHFNKQNYTNCQSCHILEISCKENTDTHDVLKGITNSFVL